MSAMNTGDAEAVVALFDPRMREALPVEKTRGFVDGLQKARGKLLRATREGDTASTTRGVYRVEAERGFWALDLHIDAQGRIAGLRFADPPAPDPEVAQSEVPLRLPFDGVVTVFWGGARVELNQHVNHKSQRRAADLLVLGEDGKSVTGDGKKNADSRIYGMPVLATAAGKVVTVIGGIPDNEPGKMNAYMAFGNTVVIEHQPRLFSTYAHLQPGKVRVKVGQTVKAGDVLGLVGNSGNSSEAHLHFQLQDGPLIGRRADARGPGVDARRVHVPQGRRGDAGEASLALTRTTRRAPRSARPRGAAR